MEPQRQSRTEVTELLRRSAAGDQQAKARLYSEVYDELKSIAHHVMQARSRDVFQTTALVNQLLLRFESGNALQSIPNRRVFFAVAIKAMNQILIDHYRSRKRMIDSDGRTRQPLDEVLQLMEKHNGCDFESLHWALGKLAEQSPRQHEVVVHRYFGGLTINETAELLDVSEGTIERDWRLARAKLNRMVGGDSHDAARPPASD